MRRRIHRDRSIESSPSTVTRPDEGGNTPQTIRIVVVFPAPFGPSTPTTEPFGTSNETSETAFTRPKRLETRSAHTAAGRAAAMFWGGLRDGNDSGLRVKMGRYLHDGGNRNTHLDRLGEDPRSARIRRPVSPGRNGDDPPC